MKEHLIIKHQINPISDRRISTKGDARKEVNELRKKNIDKTKPYVYKQLMMFV